MPQNSPQRRMVDINVLETSGVDHPAHGREGWLVKKSASAGRLSALERIMKGTAMPTTKEALLKEIGESDLPDAQKEFFTKAVDLQPEVDAAAALWRDLRAKQEAGDPEIPTVSETVDPLAPAAPAVPVAAAAPGLGADVFKSVVDPAEREALEKAAKENPGLFKAFEAMERRAQEGFEKAAAEETIRLDAEAVQKAKDDLPHLAIEHDVVAKAMRRLELVDPANAKIIAGALTKAEGQLDAADMFKEIGTRRTGGTGEGTAMAKAETLAKSYVETGVVKTQAEGLAKAFQDNPELYAEHEAEGTR